MELRETIELEMQRLGLGALRREATALEQELASLQREAAGLEESASPWYRRLVLGDTPAEQRLKGGRRRQVAIEQTLERLYAQIAEAEATLGALCPPFAVALGIAQCLSLAYREGDDDDSLAQSVPRGEELRTKLVETIGLLRRSYFPELEFVALRAQLADIGQCQRLAELADRPLATDWVLGYAPLTDVALGRVAARLLGSGFFAAEDDATELAWRGLEREGVSRASVVMFDAWDRIALLGAGQEAATQAVLRSMDRQQRLLHEAMRAYPPLDLHHGLVAALGVGDLLRVESESRIVRGGARKKQGVIAARALLLAALRRLLPRFAAVFPDVPGPGDLLAAPIAAPAPSGAAGWSIFLARAAASPRLHALQEEALMHAVMAGQVGHEKAAGEGVAAGLAARAEVSVTWTRHLWRQTIAEAEAIGAGIAPLAIRDLTVAVFAGLDEIQSERGISESRLDCPLHGREGVLAALEGLRALFRGCYGVTDGLAELWNGVMSASPVAYAVQADPIHGYAQIEAGALHGLLARHLVATSFYDDSATLARMEAEQSAETGPRRERLTAQFMAALGEYPPALLYVGLESVIAAVQNIRAASRTTHTIIGGEYDRRAVTHYRCELIGKTEAITAMQRWAAQMVEAFGEQPGYHALFEALERERTAKPG